MSKKQNMNGSDESDIDDLEDFSDPDELEILGSRFARIASGPESEKLHRARHDDDAWHEKSSKRKSFRPREKIHRDKPS